ncbi:MAG: biopolymer transporter ExbD [Candidatus Symbiothrix sp.]|jgi:biopolymer transport protein ExbD|nr:biopolymer transporter ExbD [Candidatus Symbiothrix sp.]
MRFNRQIPQINASSSADIAFLLLVFFLITSSFDSKTGIYRKMPAPAVENAIHKRMDIEQRNLLTLQINADNRILYENEEIPLKNIRELGKRFVSNAENSDFLPEKEILDIPEIGETAVTSRHVINLEVHPESTYQTYISVLGELNAAYDELRNEAANTLFQSSFLQLTLEQKDAIRKAYPVRISESDRKGGQE